MSAVPAPRRRRFSTATLLILSLSVLLHLALLRSVTGSLADAQRTDTPQPEAMPPVLVQLRPAIQPAPVAAPTPAPKPPKPRVRRAPPRPVAEPPTVASSEAPTVLAASDDQPSTSAAPADDKPGQAADTPVSQQIELPPPREESKPLRAAAPPSALLHYSVDARRSDGNYQGTGTIRFAREGSTYSVQGEVKLMFFSLLNFESSGEVVEQGLAPVLYTEKRFRKPATNTHFQRERQLVSFSASTLSYPRGGLEQDRASIVWQLAAMGNGDASQLTAGTELGIFVAGTRDGETWQLMVMGEQDITAAGRRLRTVHVLRNPRPGSYEQKLDIWLAPDLHWYPVQLRFTEPGGDQLELSLTTLPEAISGH